MVEINGFKKTSTKALFIGLALVFALLGTSWLTGANVLDYGKLIVLITAAIVLGLEVGFKRFTSASNLKEVGIVEMIGLVLVVLLVSVAVYALPIVPIEAPGTLVSAADWAIVGTSVWIIINAIV